MAPPRAPVPRLLLLLALLAATAAVQASDFESEFATARRNLQAAGERSDAMPRPDAQSYNTPALSAQM